MSPAPPQIRELRIPDGPRRELAARAVADYPHETCGFLLGRFGVVEGVARLLALVPIPNTHAGDRGRRFAVSRADYERAERASEAAGLAIIGVYHSHPDSPPRPSDEDSAFAFPGWIYWIQTVRNGAEAERAAWLRADDAWSEIDIVEA